MCQSTVFGKMEYFRKSQCSHVHYKYRHKSSRNFFRKTCSFHASDSLFSNCKSRNNNGKSSSGSRKPRSHRKSLCHRNKRYFHTRFWRSCHNPGRGTSCVLGMWRYSSKCCNELKTRFLHYSRTGAHAYNRFT